MRQRASVDKHDVVAASLQFDRGSNSINSSANNNNSRHSRSCHSERSEESQIIYLCGVQWNSQRCFASLNMTALYYETNSKSFLAAHVLVPAASDASNKSCCRTGAGEDCSASSG